MKRIPRVDGQLNIEMLVEELEKCDDKAYVQYDWGLVHPSPEHFCSCRGWPEDLGLGIETDYESANTLTASALKDALKNVVGKQLPSWKGGPMQMARDSWVWAAMPGRPARAVVGVRDEGWCVVLDTSPEDS